MTPAARAAALLAATFGGPPSGVWSAPGRVNLIGEHTDYTGGLVMPMAIEQRAWIAARPRADRLVRGVGLRRDPAQVSLDDVGRCSPTGWLAYLAGGAWVAEASGAVGTGSAHGWDLALVSHVPVGAGLSSSAAITCATLLAMNDLDGWGIGRPDLARWGQRVENEIVGVPCGIMDQSASLLCESGHALFMDTRSGQVEQVAWLDPRTQAALLVSNTNAPHMLTDGQYAHRRLTCEAAAAALGIESLRDASLDQLHAARGLLTADQYACAHHVVTENARVLRVRELLSSGSAAEIGQTLTRSHASLRDDFAVTVPQLDVSVDAALEAGAWGARMTGGGFGGCTIALVPESVVDDVSSSIDRAFAEHGFTPPDNFVARPEGGARREA
ncbi:MAG: galactokinase [Candidatus Nanopelagicales bacterium]